MTGLRASHRNADGVESPVTSSISGTQSVVIRLRSVGLHVQFEGQQTVKVEAHKPVLMLESIEQCGCQTG